MASLLLNQPEQVATRQQPRPAVKAATAFTHGKEKPARSQEISDGFLTERVLALLIIAVAAVYLRAQDPQYSTAYMDESVYVVYGRMFLSRHFESPLATPLQWTFGWYLWPAMAAIADRLGGLIALRELAALLGSVTVAAVYGFANRVFSKAVGLGTAAVMAVLAPAVLVSRIATRDSGSICFFALGLWALARAWDEDRKRDWMWAGAAFFAAFLCKYLVAIYFPLLVLATLRQGRKAFLCFSLPLFLACCGYIAWNANDLVHLLRYGSSYNALRAPSAIAARIYLWGRWDFLLLCIPALAVLAFRQWRSRAVLLWLGVIAILLFQWKSRADYDYWKHVNYALLFLAPMAVAGIILVVQKIQAANHGAQMAWGLCSVLALVAGVSVLGQAQSVERFVFWPNTEPILAFFENRLTSGDRVLVDDTVFRYYFQSTLHQSQIVDPMSLPPDAQPVKEAIQNHAFTYIILDGGIGEEARRMDEAIRPLLGEYQLQFEATEPTVGQHIAVYGLRQVTEPPSPSIRILAPATHALLPRGARGTTVSGVVTGAQPGWSVQIEVFTNRWYRSEGRIPVGADGSFFHEVFLGGTGKQQCSHLVRARLFDQNGHSRAVALNYAISRLNDDGSLPGCRAGG